MFLGAVPGFNGRALFTISFNAHFFLRNALRRQGIRGQRRMAPVYVAYTGEEQRSRALEIASALRGAGFVTEYDLLGRQLRKQLDDASSKNASVAVILAPDEIATNTVIVRSLDSGKEETHPLERLEEVLSEIPKA